MPENVTLTEAQLTEIEARANAATEGPWWADDPNDVSEIRIRTTSQAAIEARLIREELDEQDVICLGIEAEPYNAEFVAHARADVPALIAALRASRERERRLVDLIRSVGDKYDIYVAEVEAANLKEKPNRPPVIHARLELSEAIDAALAETGDEEARAALGEAAAQSLAASADACRQPGWHKSGACNCFTLAKAAADEGGP